MRTFAIALCIIALSSVQGCAATQGYTAADDAARSSDRERIYEEYSRTTELWEAVRRISEATNSFQSDVIPEKDRGRWIDLNERLAICNRERLLYAMLAKTNSNYVYFTSNDIEQFKMDHASTMQAGLDLISASIRGFLSQTRFSVADTQRLRQANSTYDRLIEDHAKKNDSYIAEMQSLRREFTDLVVRLAHR